MRERALFIFAFGQNPYTYINSISHSVEEKGVKSIYVIGIAHEDEKGNVAEPEPGSILAKISDTVQKLSAGIYVKQNWNTGHVEEVEIAEGADLDVYGRALRVLNNHSGSERIEHSNLADRIRKIISENKDAIFDVTSLKKNLLVEVVTIALANNFKEVFSSEIINKRATYDESDLYHALKQSSQFKYRNLLDSKHVDHSLKKIFRRDFWIKIVLAGLFATMIGIVGFFVEDNQLVLIMSILNALGIAGTLISLWLDYPR